MRRFCLPAREYVREKEGKTRSRRFVCVYVCADNLLSLSFARECERAREWERKREQEQGVGFRFKTFMAKDTAN